MSIPVFNKDAFKNRVKAELEGGNKQSSNNQLNGIEWVKIPDNESINIRIIPSTTNSDGWPFVEIYQHWEKNPKIKNFYSRKTLGEADPFIQLASIIWKDETLPEAERKEMFKRLMPGSSYLCYVIERGKEEDGLKYLNISTTHYNQILRYLADKDYENLLNVEDGIDIKITKLVKDKKTTYTYSPVRNNSEIYDSKNDSTLSTKISKEDFYKKIFDEQIPIMETLRFLSQEEIQKIFEEYVAKKQLDAKQNTDNSTTVVNETSDNEKQAIINRLKNKLGNTTKE